MTPDASFEPSPSLGLVVTRRPTRVSPHIFKQWGWWLVVMRKLDLKRVSKKKTISKKKRKRIGQGPNNVIWARFHRRHLPSSHNSQFITCICNKHLLVSKKKQRKKKKKHTNGPNDVSDVVWASFPPCCLLFPSLSHTLYIGANIC